MLISRHPDFPILPSTRRLAPRNRKKRLNPEVQGLWAAFVNKGKDLKKLRAAKDRLTSTISAGEVQVVRN